MPRRRPDVTHTDNQADGPHSTSDERGRTRADDAGADGPDADAVDADTERVSVLVRHAGGETVVEARPGRTLRDVLLEHGLSPYTRLTDRVNCGGRGLCATCGVRLRAGPAPEHWHDRLADRFGYPRLSCQVRVEAGMVVELDEEKVVWGARESE
jgi:ferredoxin